jgi:hypothetical protein
MSRSRLLLALSAVVASAVIAAPAEGAKKAAPKAEPDLVVSAITINGLGHNPYLLINPGGSYPHFTISITTRNVGHADAPASSTRIELQHAPFHTGIGTLNLDVPALAPGHHKTVTVDVAVPKIPLGEMRVVAYANRPHKITESNPANNIRTWGLIPVLARVWNVTTWQSDEDSQIAGFHDIDTTDPGFQFKFARLDVPTGRFFYAPYGAATTSDLFDPPGCFGINAAHASHSPWPVGSFLALSFDLTKYLGVLKTSAEPPDIVNISCDGEPPGQSSQNWIDMETNSGGGGPQSMPLWATELEGSGGLGTIIALKWTWDFTADVPK